MAVLKEALSYEVYNSFQLDEESERRSGCVSGARKARWTLRSLTFSPDDSHVKHRAR